MSSNNNATACWWPNGQTNGATRKNPQADPFFVPCDPSARHSACCALGESCTENGLCYSGSGGIYRGACTDSTWQDSACAKVCRGTSGANRGKNETVHGLQSSTKENIQILIRYPSNNQVYKILSTSSRTVGRQLKAGSGPARATHARIQVKRSTSSLAASARPTSPVFSQPRPPLPAVLPSLPLLFQRAPVQGLRASARMLRQWQHPR